MTLSKTCTACGCVKSHDQFYKHRNKCKVCYNEIERLRKYTMRYGMCGKEADKLKEDGCAICGSEDNLHIDHNHDTGEVRGVLCNCCNRGLGLFGDNSELLKAAIGYLKENGSYGRY